MNVFDKMKNTILQYWETAPEAVTMDASITEDLGADKIAVLDILMDLEEAYNLHIPEKKIGLRVGTIVEYIEASSPAVQAIGELPEEEKIPA